MAPYSRSFGRTLVNTILESEGGGVALVRTQLGPGSSHTKRGVHAWAATLLAGGQTRLRKKMPGLPDKRASSTRAGRVACAARDCQPPRARLYTCLRAWHPSNPPVPAVLPPHQVGKTIRVGGWVKTGREAGAGAFAFLEVNDGSSFQNIQVRSRVCPRRGWRKNVEKDKTEGLEDITVIKKLWRGSGAQEWGVRGARGSRMGAQQGEA